MTDLTSRAPWLLPNAAWYSSAPTARLVHITAPDDFWPRGRTGSGTYCGQSAWLNHSGPKTIVEPNTTPPAGKAWCQKCLALRRQFGDGNVVCSVLKCESCIHGSHLYGVEHPVDEGSSETCRCECIRQADPHADLEDFIPDEIDVPVSLNAQPCPLCGAAGACGYDATGRPMIHTVSDLEAEAVIG